MTNFGILLKREFKLQFSFIRNKKPDYVGNIANILITALIIGVLFVLGYSIINTYLNVRLDKVLDMRARGLELLNLIYIIIFFSMSVFGLEKMRKTLISENDKKMLLRLPVKEQTIFTSKLLTLYIMNLLFSFLSLLPVHIVFFIALNYNVQFLLLSFIPIFILPIFPFFIDTLLVVPYIKIINFVKNKFAVILILFVLIVSGVFFLYLNMLEILQNLIETGNIKNLFNERFVVTLQNLLKYVYPINLISNLLFNNNFLISFLVLISLSIVLILVSYFLSKTLFYHTLYKNDVKLEIFKKKELKEKNTFVSLLYKEFILVFRNSKNLFSYFVIALSVPVFVYGTYKLFSSLLLNSIGINFNLELGLCLVLIFTVLANTFCATNISREGIAFLKVKSLPISANKVLLSKVVFCSIVSFISLLLTTILLVSLMNINILDSLFIFVLSLIFSLSQILIATKMDLVNAKLSLDLTKTESATSKVVARVVFICLFLSLLISITVIAVSIINSFNSMNLGYLSYLIPSISVLVFFGASVFYYLYKIETKYEELTV